MIWQIDIVLYCVLKLKVANVQSGKGGSWESCHVNGGKECLRNNKHFSWKVEIRRSSVRFQNRDQTSGGNPDSNVLTLTSKVVPSCNILLMLSLYLFSCTLRSISSLLSFSRGKIPSLFFSPVPKVKSAPQSMC